MRGAILPIAEGQSEVQAVPILLRRLLERLDQPKLAAALERLLQESVQGAAGTS